MLNTIKKQGKTYLDFIVKIKNCTGGAVNKLINIHKRTTWRLKVVGKLIASQ